MPDPIAILSIISTQMIITSNGNVTWLSSTIFRSSCAINVRYFPYVIRFSFDINFKRRNLFEIKF